MKTIKEYRLNKDLITPQTLYITKDACIVNLVDLDFDLALITISDYTEQATELRTFKICNTYEPIYEDNIKYIGSFGTQHVIEIL